MKNRSDEKADTKVTAVAPLAPKWSNGPSWIVNAYAALLILLCATPLVLWGNPFPNEAVRYWLVGSALAGVFAVAFAILPGSAVRSVAGSAFESVSAIQPKNFALCVGVIALSLSALYGWAAFDRGASSTDELAQLWHARILLTGQLFLPADANFEFFSLDTVVDSARWYSHFPIGWPAVLAIGELVRLTWLINPLLFGVTSIALYLFGRKAYGETAGRLIGLTSALSPSLVIMAGTMMSHSAVLALIALALAALVHWESSTADRRAMWLALAIGLVLGLAATIRPVDALIAAIAIGVMQLFVFRSSPQRLRELPIQIAAGIIGVSPLLIANARTTGHPLLFGYEVQWGAAHSIGFHTDPYGRLYTPLQGFERALTYVSELNMYVTAWPVPAVLLAICGLLMLRTKNRWDVLLLTYFFLQVGVYASYALEGEFLGPRFLFSALPALIIPIARLPLCVAERLTGSARRSALAFFAGCFVVTWCIPALPLNAWGLGRIAGSARQNLRLDVREAVARGGYNVG